MRKPALVLFGAFDRHNFGDLLLPHIVAALLDEREFLAAGVARRDMRPYGGHDVLAIADVAIEAGSREVDLLHVGGELLTCDAWEAAVMTSMEVEARYLANQRSLSRREQLAWAHARLRLPGLTPYCVPKGMFAHPGRFLYNAAGGVDLAQHDPAFQDEVARAMREADYVSVRDRTTKAHLQKQGVAAALIPDPAVMVMELFGERIRRHAATGEPARVRDACAGGYVALQFSADFGDDATLDLLASQLALLPQQLGIVCFRAGAAPWHDEHDAYRRLIARPGSRGVRFFESLDLWDICALLANARLYCGSSLHGRIVAQACGVPGVSLVHDASRPGKLVAYLASWHGDDLASAVEPAGLGAAMQAALLHRNALDHARALAARYRDRFNAEIAPRLA